MTATPPDLSALDFDPHAREQMALRGISEADVAAALALPISRQASYAGREEVYGATLDGRTIKVVIVPGTTPLLVVTAMRIHPRRVPKEKP